jgi:Tfp pilus assembly protein PilF
MTNLEGITRLQWRTAQISQGSFALPLQFQSGESRGEGASWLWRQKALPLFVLRCSLTLLCFSFLFSALAEEPAVSEIRILEIQGTVEVLRAGATNWLITPTNQILYPADQLRTGPNSRVVIRWSDKSIIILGAWSEGEILPPQDAQSLYGLHFFQGILSFFHRDKPGRIRLRTRATLAGIHGTEFVLAVEQTNSLERATFSVIDGSVEVTNQYGFLTLTDGQETVVESDRAPAIKRGFVVSHVLQWCFYYPAVLDLEELPLSEDTKHALRDSLVQYRAGALPQALANAAGRQPESDAERVYYAALLLSVGQVQQTEEILRTFSAGYSGERLPRLASALRQLIAAVKREERKTLSPDGAALATELLARSYYEQSLNTGEQSLKTALDLARQAAARSPRFGFAWERVAELEFSFGRISQADEALDKSLDLSPQNAQALALKGFLLAARNQTREAISWFDRAIATDSGLANAWLGRGLCKIRLGGFLQTNNKSRKDGLEDLLVAAALEPQRALLRSYLGKGYADAGDDPRAARELERALTLDPHDPTGWLYSALFRQQQNRINDAIDDLELSQAHNDDRSLFRSRLRLDEDRAVRSANLASVYRDAGMDEVSVREAAKAVTYDYANDSAHLFLSDSYNELRDPTRFNLRYETVWFNELLLANLLSPVGGGRLSQHVSQQEYSRLFQADGLGVANSTLARSDNKSVQELASQFGAFGSTAYSLDLDYDYQKGFRPNNDLSSIEWYSTIKQQVTPQDTVLALVKYEDYHSGDNFQYYNQTDARPHFRFDEYQQPILVGGWHHEWSPGVHTLALAGRLITEQHFSDRSVPQLLLFNDLPGWISQPFDIEYNNQIEVYTGELNQLFQWNRVTLSLGGRYQSGTFDAQSQMRPPVDLPFNGTPTNSSSADDFERYTAYGYLTLEPLDRLWLVGGFAYDHMTFPSNFRHPPLFSGEEHRSQLGPKAAIVWSPRSEVTLRGAYTRSLGGVSLDESYRLEPTQLAGFPQAFRSLMSESLVGSVAAPEYTTYGLALDVKLATGTYAGLQVQRLESDVQRQIGVFALTNAINFMPDSTRERLDYRENSLGVSLNQLLGRQFVVGLSYTFIDAKLDDLLPEVPPVPTSADQHFRSELHQVGGYVLFNHSSGLFARADAIWYHQHNTGFTPGQPGDDFVQENLYAGWRFARRRAEILVGLLNLSGQNYHLNPLTVYSELPRKRALEVRLKFQF